MLINAIILLYLATMIATKIGGKVINGATLRLCAKESIPIRLFAAISEDAPKKRQQKAKKRDKVSSKQDGGRSRDLELLLAALDAPRSAPPPVDAEEIQRRERIKKTYTIERFRQHNEENHYLSAKLRLKQHAIRMLPRDSMVKEEALKVDDDSGPPKWRTIPAWTPPIPGFDPSVFQNIDD